MLVCAVPGVSQEPCFNPPLNTANYNYNSFLEI